MIITRFPPSPTWNFHIWWARTSFYNWLFAKQTGWKFILRIEDTDTERSTKVYEKNIIDSLEWLWMDYDAWPGKDDWTWPFHQMARLDIYAKYIDLLLKQWTAYYAWETAEELEDMRKSSYDQKKAFVYRQIDYTDEQIKQFKEEWRKPTVRFKVENKIVKWQDLVKWEINMDSSIIWDFVIMKSDGVPTYYIANVVDDDLMWITHIIRGEEHVNNTPKQILLYEAFGWKIPEFGHLPLMLNLDKSKMSKRDTKDQYVTVTKFKEEWFLKEAVLNFITLLGWHPSDDREFFTVDELIKNFSLDRITNSNAIYDFKRALWFNWEYIKNLSDEEFTARLLEYLKTYGDQEWQSIIEITEKEYWLKLSAYIKIRLQTLGQFRDYAKYFFKRQYPSEEILYNGKMWVNKELVKTILQDIIKVLDGFKYDWTEENIKNEIVKYISEKGLKNWQVLRPLRAILTGVQASPGAFEMLYVLGKKESLERLKIFAEWLN